MRFIMHVEHERTPTCSPGTPAPRRITMNPEFLQDVLDKHSRWVRGRVMQSCHGDLSLPCRAGVPATYGNGSVEVRSVIGFFVLLCAHLRDEDLCSYYAAASTLWRRRSNPARPYMVRLMTFSRLICPSTVLQGSVKAACTASRSWRGC